MSESRAAETVAAAEKTVEEFVRGHPLEQGISLGELATRLSVDETLMRTLVGQSELLELTGASVSLKGHQAAAVDERWAPLEKRLSSVAPPTLAELGIEPELLRRLLRDGSLVRVAADLVYLPSVLEEVVATARHFEAPFTVSEFRQELGVSRKHAVPLLEYLDREGITARSGDLRTAR
jgi:selenocysteine-specific elongation factor